MPNMTKAEYERLAHYLSLHSPDTEAPQQMAEHRRVLELEAQVTRLQDVLDKFEAIVHKQDARIEKLEDALEVETARSITFEAAVTRLRQALQEIIECDTAAIYEGHHEFFDGVSVAETALKAIALKALGR